MSTKYARKGFDEFRRASIVYRVHHGFWNLSISYQYVLSRLQKYLEKLVRFPFWSRRIQIRVDLFQNVVPIRIDRLTRTIVTKR